MPNEFNDLSKSGDALYQCNINIKIFKVLSKVDLMK